MRVLFLFCGGGKRDAGGDKPRPYNAAYCAESDITSSQAGAALVAARGLRDKVV